MHPRFGVPQLMFVVLALIWGMTFVFVVGGLQSFSPLQLTFGRGVVGALVLIAIALATRVSFPRRKSTWMHIAVSGVLVNAIPSACLAYAQQWVPTSIAAVISTTTPLMVVAVSITVFRDLRPTRQAVGGLIIGFVGIMVFLGVWQAAPEGQWAAVLLLLLGGVSVGFGLPYYAHFLSRSGENPRAVVAIQLSAASIVVIPFVLFEFATGGGQVEQFHWQAVAGLLALGVLVAALGNLLLFYLLKTSGPTIASMVTFAIPVVAVIIGVVFLGESLAWFEIVGGVVVLLGIAIAQNLFQRRRTAEIIEL